MQVVIDRLPISTRDAEGRARGGGHRSPGLHQSDVIAYLEKAQGKDFGEDVGQWDGYRHVGFLFERAMRDHYGVERSTVINPGEQEMDGLYLTPDGYCYREDRDEEYKATFKTIRKLDSLEEHFWGWLSASKGYCRALETRKARLTTLFLVGDWKRGGNGDSGPQLREVLLEFSVREIEDHWAMVLRTADEMRKRGVTG